MILDAKAVLAAKPKCPKCRSENRLFRSRKDVPAEPEKGELAAGVVTNYRCRDCGAAFAVRVAVKGK